MKNMDWTQVNHGVIRALGYGACLYGLLESDLWEVAPFLTSEEHEVKSGLE